MKRSAKKIKEPKPPEETIFRFARQEITLKPIDHPGRILDLGGGGEGTIEKLEGERVVAIAPMFPQRFSAEAAVGALKILMDARDLMFLDGTFPLATAFFTLMYIPGADHLKVFNEIFRVLQPGGRFYLWDVFVPLCKDENTEYYMIPLLLQLPGLAIDTGYGQPWPEQVRDLAYYAALADKAGFMVVAQREDGRVLFMTLSKPLD